MKESSHRIKKKEKRKTSLYKTYEKELHHYGKFSDKFVKGVLTKEKNKYMKMRNPHAPKPQNTSADILNTSGQII